jgi:modulator of FtsH protease
MPGEQWVNIAVLVGGASAALTGLLFVAVSVHLDRVTPHRALRTSAAETIVLLITPLLIAIVLTIPDQKAWLVGLEIIAVAVFAGSVLLSLARRKDENVTSQEAVVARQIHQLSPLTTTTLLLFISGGSLSVGWGGSYYWLVPAVMASFIGGVTNAWLLMLRVGDQPP